MLLGDDGHLRMDVRLQLATSDGAVLLARYRGPVEANGGLRITMESEASTDYDDQLIRTVWDFEAGDRRYAWLNQAVFIGEGRVRPSGEGAPGFEHRVYRAA